MTKNRQRWGRRVGGAAIVAVAALGVPALTAPPAGAVSQTTIHPEWVDGCPGCPGPYFIVQRELDRIQVAEITKSVQSGFSGLIAAEQEKNPAVAKRLHAGAIRTLQGSAAQAGNAAWSDGDWDGDLCPRKPWPWPGPGQRWDQTEKWLSDGMTLLGQANRTGDAATLKSAMTNLDLGASALTDFQGCL